MKIVRTIAFIFLAIIAMYCIIAICARITWYEDVYDKHVVHDDFTTSSGLSVYVRGKPTVRNRERSLVNPFYMRVDNDVPLLWVVSVVDNNMNAESLRFSSAVIQYRDGTSRSLSMVPQLIQSTGEGGWIQFSQIDSEWGVYTSDPATIGRHESAKITLNMEISSASGVTREAVEIELEPIVLRRSRWYAIIIDT